MIDVKNALKTFAGLPEVKNMMSALREKGVMDFMYTIGLARSPRAMILPAVGIFAVGAVIGAGAAMLLTPRTGEAFRQDVAELIKGMREKVSERVATRRHGGDGESAQKNGRAQASAGS